MPKNLSIPSTPPSALGVSPQAPAPQGPAPQGPITRRQFLQFGALTLGGAALAARFPALVRGRRLRSPREFPQHPNFLFLITDQERFPQHWPGDWDFAANLPARHRLAQNGLTFRRAFCNSAMCSPSRANLFTGLYPAQHGLDHTLTYDGPLSPSERTLPTFVPNMARMLAGAGYTTTLKGKWHLSKHSDGGPPDAADVAAYGFDSWEPTTAGEATDVDGFGGGCANWDEIIRDQALDFLRSPAAQGPNPFALVVSLVNPHDLLSYPSTWDEESQTGCFNYRDSANFARGIALPPTSEEDLTLLKPSVQEATRDLYAGFLGTLLLPQQKINYVNFYADLQMLVDAHITQLLDELEAQGLADNTIVIRLSDHGEMGLSHGGLRQKMFNVYEETMHTPLTLSNPVLFPNPVETPALASLVDVLPTVAALANVPYAASYAAYGYSLKPVIDDAIANPANPTASVQDATLFTFDDDRAGTGYNIPEIQNHPHHIRCIRFDDAEGEWKFARYFDPEGVLATQYELYHLSDAAGDAVDPNEEDNLAHEDSLNYNPAKVTAYAQKLADTEAERLAPLTNVYLPLIRK